jgi:hypothetical protein
MGNIQNLSRGGRGEHELDLVKTRILLLSKNGSSESMKGGIQVHEDDINDL